MDVLGAKAFRAWLLYYTQCMRQHIVAHSVEEQHQQKMLSKVLWAWHVLMRQQRADAVQNMRAAVVFHTTYLQQATFASWQGWVRYYYPSTVPFNFLRHNIEYRCDGMKLGILPAERATQQEAHGDPFCISTV